MKQVDQRFNLALSLARKLLSNILRVVDLEDEIGDLIDLSKGYFVYRKGDDIKIYKNNKVNYIPYSATRFTEPRIEMIKKQLEEILRLLNFISIQQNRKTCIKGFRLKLQKWRTSSKGSSLFENLGSISSICNSDCEFCYLKGSPFYRWNRLLTIREVKTRIKYYSQDTKEGLPILYSEYAEPFCNPKILEILELIRRVCPGEEIPLITNGSFLSEDVVQRLALFKPILLEISLNSSNSETRKALMKGKGHETAIKSIQLLRQYGIKYCISIVAWPSLSDEDLIESAQYAERYDPLLIRISLPGYTKFHHIQFNTGEQWKRIADLVKNLRFEVSTPLLLQPHAYWINLIEPIIDGIIKNSPAYQAGLKVGDKILEINGHSVISREEAIEQLYASSNRMHDKFVTKIKVKRRGNLLSFDLTDEYATKDDLYPYKPKEYPRDPRLLFGLILANGFSLRSLSYVKDILGSRSEVSRVLLFASPLMYSQMESLSRLVKLPMNEILGEKVIITKTVNHFWGGNIMLGDLMMVSDFVKLIDDLKRNYSFDLALVPSSFLLDWGRDYSGSVYLNIERQTGVRVKLLPCRKITV